MSGTMETGGETQAPIGEITLATLLEWTHTNSPTLIPGTLHQALHPTFNQLGSISQSINRPFYFPVSQEAPPSQSHPYQTPPNQNIPYQRPQPPPNPVNKVRNDEDQGGCEGEGEEATWNESPRNRPRGQALQGGPRGRLGPMPFDRKQHGNHPQGGDQWEVNVNQEVGQEAREGHGNSCQGGHQRVYYHNDQGGHGGRDVGFDIQF
uniref:Uncharacterized protein n=1 Tax=Solanum tuberosum TaxID=4113 RepID=M1DVU5_SOLTU